MNIYIYMYIYISLYYITFFFKKKKKKKKKKEKEKSRFIYLSKSIIFLIHIFIRMRNILNYFYELSKNLKFRFLQHQDDETFALRDDDNLQRI